MLLSGNGFSRKFGFILLGMTTILTLTGVGYFYMENLLLDNHNQAIQFLELIKVIAIMLIGAFLAIVRDMFTDKNEFTHDKVMEIIQAVKAGSTVKDSSSVKVI